MGDSPYLRNSIGLENEVQRLFEESFRKWTEIACKEWRYETPSDDYYERVRKRLPAGLRSILGYGIDKGFIVEHGKEFSLKGLPEDKGPYNWLSRYTAKRQPSPNWEYCVQVAEYVRLFELAQRNGLLLTFEDDLMDLALYRGEELIVCCEVKEKNSQLMNLLRGIKSFQDEVDFSLHDRHNDPLRKAKYIVKRRPDYFYLISIGTKLEFSVTFPEGKAFLLHRDFIPFI